METKTPKAFISYSWTSEGHKALIRQWADRLQSDSVEVVIDAYDLKEGQDKYAFMERMVSDDSVTHVLMFSDKLYAEKADERKAGVGTESLIISKEVYEKINQTKFIPIVCEFSDAGEPFLPKFLGSRIWIDFSSPEATNKNWESLIRLIYDKPAIEKPPLGKPPAYLSDETASTSGPAISKYLTLRQAILQGERGLPIYRRDFLDTCLEYADALRVREQPQQDSLGAKVLEDSGKLKHIRNHIIDWVLLESEVASSDEFSDALIGLLERLLELKARPTELISYNEAWFEAHAVFVYETFLYIVAALLKTNSFVVLQEVFTTQYLLPQTDRVSEYGFDTFGGFWGSSRTLQSVLAAKDQQLKSPAAELIKRQADRDDVPFKAVMEAELLTLFIALLTPDVRWYPQTLHYASYNREFLFFLRATHHKHFRKLATITGRGNADELREAVKEGLGRMGVDRWLDFYRTGSFWSLMNMDKLNTIK